MRQALDTNRYVDLMRGDAEVRALVEGARVVLVPIVVLAELRAGFAVGEQGRANERFLQRFLGKAGVEMVYATDATTHHYAVCGDDLTVLVFEVNPHDYRKKN